MARHLYPSSKVFVFARSPGERDFARELGACWAGDTADRSPEKLHRAIDTTPVWGTIVHALGNLERGGRLVINAIRKEEIDKEELLALSYPEHLWLEKEIKSVANVASGTSGVLDLAGSIPIRHRLRPRARRGDRALLNARKGRYGAQSSSCLRRSSFVSIYKNITSTRRVFKSGLERGIDKVKGFLYRLM
jgi:propanol-preferring alcohol dehydrogenase